MCHYEASDCTQLSDYFGQMQGKALHYKPSFVIVFIFQPSKLCLDSTVLHVYKCLRQTGATMDRHTD